MADVDDANGDGHDDGQSRRTPSIACPTTPPCEGGVRHAPPKFGEGGGRRSPGRCDPRRPRFGGCRSSRLRRPRKIPATMPSFSSLAPTNGVTTTSPEGKDMAGGGRGGPVIFPHPDDDDAGHLLDNVGSTNANDDDNDDIPPRPPRKQRRCPLGGGRPGRQRRRMTT